LQQLYTDALNNNSSVSSSSAVAASASSSTAVIVKRDSTYICFLVDLLGSISCGVAAMSWLALPPLPPSSSSTSLSSTSSSSSLLQVADHRIIGNSINHRDEHQHNHHQWLSALPEHTKQQLQTQLLSMKATWISLLTTIKSSSSSLSIDYPSRDSGIYVLAVLQQISSKVSKVMSENAQLMQGILIMMMIMMI
jgi:hypothetical protein